MKVKVKVCGITSLSDAMAAAILGADALGFIFYKKSPRFIEPERARKIISNLPPMVKTVGVFVDEQPENIKEIGKICGLDLFQLHGEESPEFCKSLMPRSLKAIRIRDKARDEEIHAYKGSVRGILLDTWSKDAKGGTGQTFNWEIARDIVKGFEVPVILAGGLNPENIKDAIKKVKPYGVDVSSGVEKAPGVKDQRLLEEFFMALKGI